jgi:3-deoxy-D-manno-octulosonate 8-phosphate phosphatase (KDO 8-P phosphatase)
MKFENFVIDVDGVLTGIHVLYDSKGMAYKMFGPDDHDALNMLRDKIKIFFITSNKRGFKISKRRVVDEMKFDLYLLPFPKRLDWLEKKLDLKKTIFMGDGILDYLTFREVGYSICPQNAFYKTRQEADFVTKSKGGERAVAEACIHILEKFFDVKEFKASKKYGAWGKQHANK